MCNVICPGVGDRNRDSESASLPLTRYLQQGCRLFTIAKLARQMTLQGDSTHKSNRGGGLAWSRPYRRRSIDDLGYCRRAPWTICDAMVRRMDGLC